MVTTRFGSYTVNRYNIDLGGCYNNYNGIGNFGIGFGRIGYYGGYPDYSRYTSCFSPISFGASYNPLGFGGALLANSLVTPYNYGSSLYFDETSPSGVASVSPFVDYAINRPYLGGGFTGFSLFGALSGGLLV